jgi:DNA processing protein
MELEASLSWFALTLTPGIAARLSARLLREFGSPEAIFRASLTSLEACNLPAPTAQAIFKKQLFWRAEKEVDAVRRIGCRILNWTEPEYPQSLLQIYDPPVLLYVRGDAKVLNSPSLSIVGTRRPTVYGTQMADRLGRDLARRGLTIVSGLARGVDAIAHQGATSEGGRAVGVLGTGIDICYPKENKKLFEKVLERGAIISELPTGSHPAPENFPVRNRIIAGMPLGVLIVEGKQYSGSLITARLAMEFGREVFGVPGNVTQEVSFAEACGSEQRNLLVEDGLNVTEKRIYELLSAEESRHIDDIVETSGLNSHEVLATLFDLEMKGIIRQLPGKQFNKVLL